MSAPEPREFTQHAPNPARSVPIGGKHTVFALAYGPPFVSDLDGGRRYGTLAALEGAARGLRAATARCGPGGGPERVRDEAQTVDAGRARLERPPRSQITVKSICYLFKDLPLGCLPDPLTGALLMPAQREAVT
jgi:Trimethylamine methyltransferase (MTTB)